MDKMIDIVETLGQSTIQHGSYNNRIYVMNLSRNDFPQIIKKLGDLAQKNNYGKIFVKIPQWAKHEFLDHGFVCEAIIPDFFNGKNDGFFLSKFLEKNQQKESEKEKKERKKVLDVFYEKKKRKQKKPIASDFDLRVISEQDISSLTQLYKQVFKSYPFPIFSPDFIKETMKENVCYYGLFDDHRLIAAASAEMNPDYEHVEMTDFATFPSYRGKNTAASLLYQMEEDMKKKDFKTCFTIARSCSFGMNSTFGKADYEYGGTLIHNTNISGRIESMNVLFKKIKD